MRCHVIVALSCLSMSVLPAGSYAQTWRDDSLRMLFAAPDDALAYNVARTHARALVAARNWIEAEPVVEKLTQQYPRDGDNWILLARVKGGLDKHREAADAYDMVGRLRGWMDNLPGYNAVIQRLAAGDTTAALRALRRELFDHRSLQRSELFTWPQLAGLRNNDQFRELVAAAPATVMSRTEGWRKDLDHLYAEIARVNPEYHNRALPAELTRRYDALKVAIPRLSDEQILVEMSRMLSVLRQGHTGVWDLSHEQSRIPLKRVPLQFYAFPEGMYVVNAEEPYKSLVGSRILAIGEKSADEAMTLLKGTQSVDGVLEHLFRIYYLQEAALLKGLGLTASLDSVRMTLEAADGSVKTHTILTQRADNRFKLAPPPGVPAPLFLRNVGEAHWALPLSEHQALYIQFNQVRDDPDESLSRFAARLRPLLLSDSAPGNLIVDVRHNNGGNSNLYMDLLRVLVAYSQLPEHKLFVLIGRGTYSAAGNFITELERLADPLFVGEASSECCTLFGDATWVRMPYSRVAVAVTGTRWNLGAPWDARREMSPDLPVQLHARDYFGGRDPALEAVLALIGKK